jgi:mycofactocin precursor peptide peptidase
VSSLLARWSSADVAATRPVVAIPVGSCEQHGPHLPLGTDTIIAIALAERLAGRRPDVPVLVGPSLSVTSSGEHAGFAGTLSIGAAVTEATIVELARSADWASGIVLVNWHGGNVEAVAAADATIRAEGRKLLSWWPHIAGGDAHAGRTETSIMLALHPELVVTERAVAGDVRPLAAIAGELRRHGIGAVSPSGVLGDPTDATLEEGRDLLDTLTDDLVSAVDDARNTW